MDFVRFLPWQLAEQGAAAGATGTTTSAELGSLGYLPWGTLVIVLFTFAIWMAVKQNEVVNKPPGPNMVLVVVVLFFLLAMGFVAPLLIQSFGGDVVNVTLFSALSFVGIGGGTIALLMGGIRLLTGGKK